MLDILDIGCNMINAEKYIKLFLKKSLERFSLSATEGLILLLFIRNEQHGLPLSMTQERILNDLKYDKGVINRSVQSLEKKGYLNRETNADDRRFVTLSFSPAAEKLKETLINLSFELSKNVFVGLNQEEIRKLSFSIDKISENAWDYYKKIKEVKDD